MDASTRPSVNPTLNGYVAIVAVHLQLLTLRNGGTFPVSATVLCHMNATLNTSV